MKETVNLTIDGTEVSADPEMTILEAAEKIGIEIPQAVPSGRDKALRQLQDLRGRGGGLPDPGGLLPYPCRQGHGRPDALGKGPGGAPRNDRAPPDRPHRDLRHRYRSPGMYAPQARVRFRGRPAALPRDEAPPLRVRRKAPTSRGTCPAASSAGSASGPVPRSPARTSTAWPTGVLDPRWSSTSTFPSTKRSARIAAFASNTVLRVPLSMAGRGKKEKGPSQEEKGEGCLSRAGRTKGKTPHPPRSQTTNGLLLDKRGHDRDRPQRRPHHGRGLRGGDLLFVPFHEAPGEVRYQSVQEPSLLPRERPDDHREP